MCLPVKILETILKMNQGGTQTKWPKGKKTEGHTQDYTSQSWKKTDSMCQEMKEEEDSLALNIVITNQDTVSRTTIKKAEKYL